MKRYKLCGQYSEWGMVDLETDDYFFDNDDGEWVIASEAAAALEAKDAEIARLREALEFYAAGLYVGDWYGDGAVVGDVNGEKITDTGDIARAALQAKE